MKTLYIFVILSIFAAFSTSLQILDQAACGRCALAECPPVVLPCNGLFGLDNCLCCAVCLEVVGGVLEKRSSSGGGDEVALDGQQAAGQEQEDPALNNLQSANPGINTHLYNSEEIGNSYNVKREVIFDVLHDTIVKQTEPPPATFEDKIRNTVRRTLLVPLQRGTQVAVDLGSMVANFFLTEKESESGGFGETAGASVNNGHITAMTPQGLPTKEPTAFVSRGKRETPTGMTRIMQLLHQVMMNGNAILRMLTESGPQQVIHCALSKVSIPGSHILADIARIVMEGIHESAVYAVQTKSSVENPTWDTLTQTIVEAIDKGFAKASSYVPKILDAVKEFLSYNPALIENTKEPTQAIENTLGSIREYWESMNKLLEEVTNAEMRQRIKSLIKELVLPGSNVFAEVVNALMAITNAISKSRLESAFIKDKSTIQNLLVSIKNGITVGVIETYKVIPEIIKVAIETIENRNIVYDDIANMEQFSILKATKIRPVVNAYLQFICDNVRYTKSSLREQTTHSDSVTAPVLMFFVEVDVYVKEILSDVGDIICASKVLHETDSWDSLIEAGYLINNIGFERLASFQSKYSSKSADLNKLLNYLGCDGTTKIIPNDEDLKILINESIVEIIQSTLKRISGQLQMRTNEMIDRNQILSAKLTKLPGGEILNIVTNITLQVINEMSRQMSKSYFITKPPTWFNFWFSVIEAVTVGVTKAEDVFLEAVNSVKQSSMETLRTDRSLRLKRGSPGKIIPRDIAERHIPLPSPVPNPTQKTTQTSPAGSVLPVTSTIKPDVRNTTGIAVTEALKPCAHGKCDEYDVAVRRFTPGLLSQHFLDAFHQFLIQLCKGVQGITGFLSALVVPPFIRRSGIPFANEVAEIASEAINLSSEVATKSLQTPFLQNSPTWEAAEDFIIDSIRNAATGAIRLTIRFLSFVSDKLSEKNGPISTMFKCAEHTEHKKTDPNVVISFRYRAASNNTNATDSPLVQDLSSALSDVHDALSVAAVKNKEKKATARTSAPKEQKFLILRFIRGILRFEKLTSKLIAILIPETCLVPAQQFLKQTATGISTLTGKLARSGVTFQVKTSNLPLANLIADFLGKFFKNVNQLSSDAANSKYLNEPNPTWSMANKAVTSAVKSGLQLGIDVIVKAMKLIVKALSNFPEILIEESDVLKRSERSANVNTTGTTRNKTSIRAPLAQKWIKRSYLKRMRERDHSTL